MHAPHRRPHLSAFAALTLIAGLAVGCSTAQADERTDAIVAEANELASEGDLLRAAEVLRRGADEESRSSENRARLFEAAARQYAAVGRVSLALASAEQALKLAPTDDRRFAVDKLADAVAQERAPGADRPFAGPATPEEIDESAAVNTRRRLTNPDEKRAEQEWQALREILTRHGVEPERIKRVEEDFLRRRRRGPSLVELRPGTASTRWTRTDAATAESRRQIAELHHRVATLRSRGLGDQHPEVVRVRDEIGVLTRRLRDVRGARGSDGSGSTAGQGGPLTYVKLTRLVTDANRSLEERRELYEEARRTLAESHPDIERARLALVAAERQVASVNRVHENWDATVQQVRLQELRNQIHRYELRLAELKQSLSFDDPAVRALHAKIDERNTELALLREAHTRIAQAEAEANQRWIEVAQARERLARDRQWLAAQREAGKQDSRPVRHVEERAAELEARLAELEAAHRRHSPALPVVTRRSESRVEMPEFESPELIESVEELPIDRGGPPKTSAELRDRLARAEEQIEELQKRLSELLDERAEQDR